MMGCIRPVAKIKLCIFLIGAAFLSACATGPAPQSSTPGISTKVAPLAAADQTAYANAVTALEKGDIKEAAVPLKKIAEANPGYLDVWVNLALTNFIMKNNDAAKLAIEHAQALQPQSSAVHNVQGLIFAEAGLYNKAEQLYLTALKLDSKNANAHYNLALLYDIYYQDVAKAIPYYENYLALSAQKDEATEAWTDELKQTLSRRNSQ